jgi:hypothetical protein
MLTNINPKWALNTFAKKKYNFNVKLINHILYITNYFNISFIQKGYQAFYLLKKK